MIIRRLQSTWKSMDRSQCTGVYATDTLLLRPRQTTGGPPSCDVYMVGYGIWFLLLAGLKLFTATGLSYDWYNRYIVRKVGRSRSNNQQFRRLPIVPVLSWVQALLVLTFAIFSLTGNCSSSNGCGLAMAGCCFLIFGTYGLFLLKQFIRLGKSMIPIARSKIRSPVTSTVVHASGSEAVAGSGGSNADTFAKEDAQLRIIIFGHILALLAQWIIAVPIQLSRPADEYDTYLTVVFALQSGYMALSILGYLKQLQRLVQATKVGCIKPYHPDVKRALHKMRNTEIGYTMIHVIGILTTLLIAVRVIPASWYMLLIIYTAETMSTTLTFIWFVLQRYRRQRKQHSRDAIQSKATHIPGETDSMIHSIHSHTLATTAVGGDNAT